MACINNVFFGIARK